MPEQEEMMPLVHQNTVLSGLNRRELLGHRGARLLASHGEMHPDAITDLVACWENGKHSCFLILDWKGECLVNVDLLFTEEEARARLAHGRTYCLSDFALPPAILRQM